jgi:phospholipid/cholesterol/gamma-HCH transport system ATP-binding protein
MSSTPLLDIRDLTKSFGGRPVLKGINLTIPKGSSTVIIGGSGSGKSVLLKCILGLITPDSGQVLVDGHNTTHLSEKERYKLMTRFGMLFQNGALFDSLSVWENVSFGLLRDGVKHRAAYDTAIEKLAMVGLAPHVADQNPAELSGGMKKRVALARAICQQPEIIFYDEPTTGLDPITSDVINELILKLKRELGITSLTITHDMHSAYKIADHMAMLFEGQIIAYGTVAHIRDSDNPYVQQFIHGRAEGPIKMAVNAH